MQSEELKEALRLLTKALHYSSVGPARGRLLQSAKRELETAARSGKLDRRKVFLAVENVATVLLELVEDDEATRG
jgi:hypothetical protein